jgi:hypothetical protein
VTGRDHFGEVTVDVKTDIKDGGCEGVYWLNLVQNKGDSWAVKVTVTSLLMP